MLPSFCSSRLDSDPLFYLLLHALALDCAEIDHHLKADALLLNAKIGQARRMFAECAASVATLAAHAHALESKLVALLRSKEAAAADLHARVTGAVAGAAGDAAKAAVHDTVAVDLSRRGAAIANLSAAIKTETAAWKEAVWKHGAESVRADELKAVCDAVMAQLIFVSNRAEADKRALVRMLLWTMVRAWTGAHASARGVA